MFEAAVTDARHRGTHRDEDPPSAQCWPNPESSQSQPGIIHITLFSLFGQTNYKALICCASCITAGSEKYAHVHTCHRKHTRTVFSHTTDIVEIIKHNILMDCLECMYTQTHLWKFLVPLENTFTPEANRRLFSPWADSHSRLPICKYLPRAAMTHLHGSFNLFHFGRAVRMIWLTFFWH